MTILMSPPPRTQARPMTVAVAEAGPSRLPVYPHGWREIINGLLEENFPAIALGSLDALTVPDLVPSPEHIQFLLFLTLRPPPNVSPTQPLSALYHLLSTHAPSTLSSSLPCHGSISKTPDGGVSYLSWDNRRSDLHRSVWRLMRKCQEEGIWALLWREDQKDIKTKGRGKRKRSAGGDEEDEEGVVERIASDEGWGLLEWLVELWEKDRAVQLPQEGGEGEERDDVRHSPMFLAQLPKPYDSTNTLQRSDATLPLTIVRTAFTPGPSSDSHAGSSMEQARRQRIAARLLLLVLDTSLSRSAPFHPPSLSSSLVHLIRHISLEQLISLRQALPSRLPEHHLRALSHIYALAIEDLAGVRQQKLAERQAAAAAAAAAASSVRRAKGRTVPSDVEKEGKDVDFGTRAFDRPTASYALDLLVMSPALSHSTPSPEGTLTLERVGKMIYLKSILLDNLLLPDSSATHPHPNRPSASTRIPSSASTMRMKMNAKKGWWEEFESSLQALLDDGTHQCGGGGGAPAAEEEEGMRRKVVAFAKVLKIRVRAAMKR